MKKLSEVSNSIEYPLSLQSMSLKVRHLPLLGALVGNDCIPPKDLKELHIALAGGRKKVSGLTRRQNIIKVVADYIIRNKGFNDDHIIKQV